MCDLNEYEKVIDRFQVGSHCHVTLDHMTVTVMSLSHCSCMLHLLPLPHPGHACLQVSVVHHLFAALRDLCNLIIIQPEHIRAHCSSELVS